MNLPAVSFLKAPEYQDGHAGYSDPLDEQNFLVNTINAIQNSPFWKSTAIVIAYDDSDGWYDHVARRSRIPRTTRRTTRDLHLRRRSPGGYEDRCGSGPRLPLLVISPWSKTNYVSDHLTDRPRSSGSSRTTGCTGTPRRRSFDAISGSLDGRGGLLDFRIRPHFRPLILDPATGEVVS